MKIAFLCVATGRYKEFVMPLHDGLHRLFPDLQRKMVVCTDGHFQGTDVLPIVTHAIKRGGFPNDTLKRYHFFLEAFDLWKDSDLVLYLDVDMAIDQVLLYQDLPLHRYTGQGFAPHAQMPPGGDALFAVCHPGYVRNTFRPFGTPEFRPISQAYLPAQVLPYVYGGVQGGKTDAFYRACQVMKERIDTDLQNGVMPIWHDESMWNRYVNEHASDVLLLSPSLSYAHRQARAWGIDIWPSIIATIDKDHAYYRQDPL
jgi:histo-blood group ABO system transferase